MVPLRDIAFFKTFTIHPGLPKRLTRDLARHEARPEPTPWNCSPKVPDLGALEAGQPLPTYGPRR